MTGPSTSPGTYQPVYTQAQLDACVAHARRDGIEEGRGDMEHLERKWRAEARRECAEELRADIRSVLDQDVMHAHQRSGVWDWDNRPGKANTRCEECAARERLVAWLSGSGRTPADEG